MLPSQRISGRLATKVASGVNRRAAVKLFELKTAGARLLSRSATRLSRRITEAEERWPSVFALRRACFATHKLF